MNFLITQFVQLLSFLNEFLGSLGISIIIFTLLIRLVLLPITLSSIRAQKKLKDLQPELKKISGKFKNNKKALQAAQMELYKKYNINPLAGCLPQIVQIFVLIILYRALLDFLGDGAINGTNLQFFWLNLGEPDKTYILPILAGATQLLLSLMIAPGAEIPDVVSNKSKKKKIQEANKKEENTAEMAATMQQQMLFIMPLMTGFLAARFPSGLALYWVVATVFSVAQQYYVSGWGGLASYWQRLLIKIRK
ncbi:MAG: YidC/Oxa1 family membrane protein insertase [Candidatus Paceibacterota bacterium]